MRLFHTSDWHLGRMLYGRSLLEDQRWFLRQVFLPAVERERPACVLIAGDVYDRQIAPVEAIQLFDETLLGLLELGTTVCVISGNHDGAGRMALLKSALRRSGAIFATTLEDAFSPVELEENGERLQLFLLPYFDTAQARDFLGDGSLRGEGPCAQALLERLPTAGLRRILVLLLLLVPTVAVFLPAGQVLNVALGALRLPGYRAQIIAQLIVLHLGGLHAGLRLSQSGI